jgi:hypothetical protein
MPNEISPTSLDHVSQQCVLDCDVVNWRKEIPSAMVLNGVMKLADLRYLDHSPEPRYEASLTAPMLKQAFDRMAEGK